MNFIMQCIMLDSDRLLSSHRVNVEATLASALLCLAQNFARLEEDTNHADSENLNCL